MTSGIERHYRLFTPAKYDPSKATPVVFDVHGFGSSSLQQLIYSKISPLADRETFIAVLPDGQGSPRHFNLAFNAPAGEGDDVVFMTDLLAKVREQYCVDSHRVFATGMSNGGVMSSLLACKANDQFAAFAPVSVVVFTPECGHGKPISMLAFKGTKDATVPYEGGVVSCCGNPIVPSTISAMEGWAIRAECTVPAQESKVAEDVTLLTYKNCADGSEVAMYRIEGGGHTWPGGVDIPGLGYTTANIDAIELAWEFFKKHPLP